MMGHGGPTCPRKEEDERERILLEDGCLVGNCETRACSLYIYELYIRLRWATKIGNELGLLTEVGLLRGLRQTS